MAGINALFKRAYQVPRNYIIDQTNVYPTAQRRKMMGFAGCHRRAVVICPTDDDLKRRTAKREAEEGKDVPDEAVLQMKGNFKLPFVGESFDEVEYVELQEAEAEVLVAHYNQEGAQYKNSNQGPRGPQRGRRGTPSFSSGGNSNRGNSFNNRGGGFNNRGNGFNNRGNPSITVEMTGTSAEAAGAAAAVATSTVAEAG